MPLTYRSRYLRYIAGYFPADFQVDVMITPGYEDNLVITILAPSGLVASHETTATQALDIMAMCDIAEMLKMRLRNA